MKKKLIGSILLGMTIVLGCAAPAMADSRKVVTLGADLSEDQKNTMMRYFGVNYDSVDVIYINNTDERNHLGSYVPLEQIGSHTYSCALVAPTTSGGIQVKTANLEWVTCNMIASTLSTSGVTNCQVVAACPFKVSGTGALTGVIMAYETASKEKLDPVKVELANQELVTTGNLANEVGQSKATAVINETKIQVIENNVTDVDKITDIVYDVSNNYDININEDQSAEIVELMEKIAEQEYDIIQLQATLDRVQANVAGDAGASEEEQKAAEEKAQAAEAAALEAAQKEQQELLEQGGAVQDEDGVVIVDDITDFTEDDENILDGTDPSALEDGGATVSEEDTTQTVQEQQEQQSETENELGIPEATDDGTISVDEPIIVDDNLQNQTEQMTEALQPEEQPTEALQPEEQPTEALQPEEQMTEAPQPATEAIEMPTVVAEENLDEIGREIYDAVKADMTHSFEGGVVASEDGSAQVYLSEAAAKAFPEKIEQYVLKVLTQGAAAVAAEEAADTTISQNIVSETAAQAPDKVYEDEDMIQIDKYVRRLVFKDSENFLADSYLEDADKAVLYNRIMSIVENAYNDDEETVDDLTADASIGEIAEGDMADMPEEDGYMPAEELSDEFSDFVEEVGSF